MKNLIPIFLLISSVIFAQNQRFIYEYKFQLDSTNAESAKTEMMFLDVTPQSSRYYSYDTYKQDSIRYADFEKQIRTTGAMNVVTTTVQKSFVRYSVSKTYQDFKLYLHTRVGPDSYKVFDQTPMNWKIENEKQKIGEFDAQKATTFYQGRKWTAWFAPEIPLQDGPYKFHGLPGLIVKVYNDNQTHVMELKAVKKNDNPVDFTKGSLTFSNKEMEVDYKTFAKLYKENRNDPGKSMRQMMSSGQIRDVRDANGNPLDMAKMARDMERNAAERNKKDNNQIDLSLLK